LGLIFAGAIHVSHEYQSARRQCDKECGQVNPKNVAPSASTKNCDECQEGAERNFPSWYRLVSWPEGIGAWVVLLTLMAIAEQTNQTRRAAEAAESSVGAADREYKLSEDTAKRELRAYVCIDSSEWRFKAGVPTVTVAIRNCGQTPAYKVQGWLAAEIADYMPTLSLDKPNDAGFQLSSSVLGPGGIVELEAFPMRKLTETDRSGVQNGKRTFFAYGRISYEDAFQESRWTSFRLIAGRGETPRSRMENGVSFYILSPDSSGNDAT
jgi:hypothetical protein